MKLKVLGAHGGELPGCKSTCFLVDDVLSLAAGRPELLAPITDAPTYLQVEAVYAAEAEGALHLEDVLARRTRISIEYAHRGTESMRRVAEIMAPVLGWSAAEQAREVEVYQARVDAERRSQTEPDDASAEKMRLEAPEVRDLITSPVA